MAFTGMNPETAKAQIERFGNHGIDVYSHIISSTTSLMTNLR